MGGSGDPVCSMLSAWTESSDPKRNAPACYALWDPEGKNGSFDADYDDEDEDDMEDEETFEDEEETDEEPGNEEPEEADGEYPEDEEYM